MAHVESGQLPASSAEFAPRTRAERRRLEEQQAKRRLRRDRGDDPGRRRGRGRRSGKKPLSFWQEFPVLILVAIVLALLIKTFLVQAFYIPSESMQDTLQVRDRVLVNKLVYNFRAPKRGEVVVFNGVQWQPEVQIAEPGNSFQRGLRTVTGAIGVGPPNEKDYIKRVIGLPGETVACCDDAGRVTVNDRALVEPYILDNTPQELRAFGPITVPEGRLWVMGDHRGVSADSRAHAQDTWHGTIPIDNVVGRAFVIVWPVGRAGGLPVPSALDQPAARGDPGVGDPGTVAPGVLLPLLPQLPVSALAARWRRRG